MALAALDGASRGLTWGEGGAIIFATAAPATGLQRVSSNGRRASRPDDAEPRARRKRSPLAAVPAWRSGRPLYDHGDGGRNRRRARGGSRPAKLERAAKDPGDGRQPGTLRLERPSGVRARRHAARRRVRPRPPRNDRHVGSGRAGGRDTRERYCRVRHRSKRHAGVRVRRLAWRRRGPSCGSIARGARSPSRGCQRDQLVGARLSPDGTRVALEIRDRENDIWLWDFARGTLDRLTMDPGTDQAPVWTPDGLRVIFTSEAGGGPGSLFWQTIDGSGKPERLTPISRVQRASAVLKNGTILSLGKSPRDRRRHHGPHIRQRLAQPTPTGVSGR